MIISRSKIKEMDRVGGAVLILQWPSHLPPGQPVAPDEEREATRAEWRAAEAIVGAACTAAGLVPVHVRVVSAMRPPKYPAEYQWRQHLAVTIIGRRWVHASTRAIGRDLWMQPTDYEE